MSEKNAEATGSCSCTVADVSDRECAGSQEVDAVIDRRVRLVYMLCCIFILLGTFMLLRPVWLDRQDIIAESCRLSFYEGVMPAVRGRIIGHDGTAVAWSERKFDLYCIETRPAERAKCIDAVASVIKGIVDNGADKPLRSDLLPGEYAKVRSGLSEKCSLRTVSRNIRKYNDVWQDAAGTVLPGEDGIWVGVSGWEAEYEEELSGVPGRFEVNLDPHGNWIRDTFRITLAPIQGEDVVVTLQ